MSQWSWRLGPLDDIVELETYMAGSHWTWVLGTELRALLCVLGATEPFLQLPFPKALTLIMCQVLLSQPNYSAM